MKNDEYLIALCGMNCGICMAYLRTKNKCNGCRAVNTWNPKTRVECKIKNCSFFNTPGSLFCFECEQYPCGLVKNMDRRYKARYRMSVIENLEKIRERGLETFQKAEKKKWRCRFCGDVINVHKGICNGCGKEHNIE